MPQLAHADWLGDKLRATAQTLRSIPDGLTDPGARAASPARNRLRRHHDSNVNIGDIGRMTTAIRKNIGQTFNYAATGMEGVEHFVATVGSGASRIQDTIGSGMPAPALAAAIRNARNLHYPHSRPLPSRVIAVLSRTMPMNALKRARYVRSDHAITLPNLVNGAQKMFAGNDHAVVVDDVIVFSAMPGATTAADIHWWAHEVHHVYQYQVWGIDKFAANYLKDPDRIEKRARQVAARAVAHFLKTAGKPDPWVHAHR